MVGFGKLKAEYESCPDFLRNFHYTEEQGNTQNRWFFFARWPSVSILQVMHPSNFCERTSGLEIAYGWSRWSFWTQQNCWDCWHQFY